MFEEDILKPNTYDALCVVLCTDEPKYIDPDSHYLHIPEALFVKYVSKINLSNVCFELTNPNNTNTNTNNTNTNTNNTNNTNKRVYLRKIEPAQGEFKSNILIPSWVQNQLGIGMCGSQLELRPVPRPQSIIRCKIRGNNSSYVKLDIKTLLEEKINQFKCVNLNTNFTVQGVIFTIVELVSSQNKLVEWGIINNELEIDFDTPDDIKFIEKRKTIMDKITLKIEDKINSINKQKSEFGKKKTGVFKFSDFVAEKTELNSLLNQQIDWNGLLVDVDKELENEYTADFIELELNKNILRDLIEEGKNIQKKIAEELKKTNLEETKTKEDKCKLFNTKAYKLNDETSNYSMSELTREEIRKARLSKLC